MASFKREVPSQVHSTPDVQISRFDKESTTSKAAFARSQLAKRFVIDKAQQRPIPIQSLSNTTNGAHEHSTNSIDQQQTATSLAATVAASVAVSVAQPFLKLQNDFEQKMNSMLTQIQRQQERSVTSGSVIPITKIQNSSTENDSKHLLDDCVDTRMKYMEKVQEHQQRVLKQLVDMAHSTKPGEKLHENLRGKSNVDESDIFYEIYCIAFNRFATSNSNSRKATALSRYAHWSVPVAFDPEEIA